MNSFRTCYQPLLIITCSRSWDNFFFRLKSVRCVILTDWASLFSHVFPDGNTILIGQVGKKLLSFVSQSVPQLLCGTEIAIIVAFPTTFRKAFLTGLKFWSRICTPMVWKTRRKGNKKLVYLHQQDRHDVKQIVTSYQSQWLVHCLPCL